MTYGIATGAWEGQRDDWDAAIARAVREKWTHIELTAVGNSRLDSLIDIDPSTLGSFDRVSLHTPSGGLTAGELITQVGALPFEPDLILHPDVWRDEALRAFGARAVFENMDLNKEFGKWPGDLADVFDRFPDAGFCLDVAHVWTNDTSLALGHELLDAFGTRLRQLHVSGIDPDGTHRETTPADLDLYGPLLERCGDVPWILEGALSA